MSYDGSVKIQVEADDKQAQKDLNRLSREVSTLQRKLEQSTSSQNDIADKLREAQREATAAYTEVERLEKRLQRSREKTSVGYTGTIDPAQFTAELEKQERISAELEKQRAIHAEKEAAAAKLDAQDTKAVQTIEKQTAALEGKKAEINEINAALAQQSTQQWPQVRESVWEAMNGASVNLRKGLRDVLKYGFGIRSVFVLTNRLRRVLTEGLQEYAEYDDETRRSIDALKSSLAGLRGSFISAVAPVANVVAPALAKLIDWFAKGIDAAGQFIAVLTGNDYYQKAVVHLDSVADSATGVSEAVKEARRQLSGLDEMNRWESGDTSGSGGGGSSAGSGSGGISYDPTPVDASIKEAAEKAKAFWQGVLDEIFPVTEEGFRFIDWSKFSFIPKDKDEEHLDDQKKKLKEKIKEKLKDLFSAAETVEIPVPVKAAASVSVPETLGDVVREKVKSALAKALKEPSSVTVPESGFSHASGAAAEAEVYTLGESIAEKFAAGVVGGSLLTTAFGNALAAALGGAAGVEMPALGMTVNITDANDNIPKTKKTIEGWNAQLSDSTDKISLKDKILSSYTAKLEKNDDQISLKDKLLSAYTAKLEKASDAVPAADKTSKGWKSIFQTWDDAFTTAPWSYSKAWFSDWENWKINPWSYSKSYFNNWENYGISPWSYAKSWYNDWENYGISPWSYAKSWYNDWENYFDKKPWSYADAYVDEYYTKSAGGGWTLMTKAGGGVFKNGLWHDIASYAAGGAPYGGQIFRARENGNPELVGTIRGSTAVMNNDQIVASVASGLVKAFSGLSFELRGLPALTPDMIPPIARGQVVPPLALNEGSGVEDLKAAVERLTAALGDRNRNTYNVTAKANGRVLFDLMLEEGRSRRDASGRNPFLLDMGGA